MVSPNGSETSKALAQVVRLLSEGLMDETFAEAAAAGADLTAAQFEVLGFIDRHLSPTVGEVAEGLSISSAAATKAVTGLAERPMPLVFRHRGLDRRMVLLETSPEGHELVQAIRDSFSRRLDEILERIPPLDRARLDDGLRAFLQAALARPVDCDAACLRCGVDHSDECVVHIAGLLLNGARVAPC